MKLCVWFRSEPTYQRRKWTLRAHRTLPDKKTNLFSWLLKLVIFYSGIKILGCVSRRTLRNACLLTIILQRLLHALRNKDVGDGDLSSVAWNYASKRHMLASACHDGSVRIWTSSAPERDGTRGKDRENASITSHPYGLDHDMEVSVSPMNMSRRPTGTDGAHHTHGEPSTYVTGRTSLEGSTEGAGPSYVEPMDRRERRRVESPVPAELAEDKNADSNSFFKKSG
jgi:hypothetical protein